MRILFILPLLLEISSSSLVDEYLAAVSRFSEDDGKSLRSTNPVALKDHFLAFKEYKQTVDEINSDSNSLFTAEINQFSIMTKDERALHTGINITSAMSWDQEEESTTALSSSDASLPSYVNWVSRGAQVPVKQQGGCGSCWIFSAISAFEGGYYLATGDLIDFSEQEMLDCSLEKTTAGKKSRKKTKKQQQSTSRSGCDGGWMNRAFAYVELYDRLASAKQAPYMAEDRKCNYEKTENSLTKAKLRGHIQIVGEDDTSDEVLLQYAAKGIVSVVVRCPTSFFTYSKGLYKDVPGCEAEVDTLHAISVVGYGLKGGHPYWRVRNSWGPNWGYKGHMLMDRKLKNNCKISWRFFIPTFKCTSGQCNPPTFADQDPSGDEEDDEKQRKRKKGSQGKNKKQRKKERRQKKKERQRRKKGRRQKNKERQQRKKGRQQKRKGRMSDEK